MTREKVIEIEHVKTIENNKPNIKNIYEKILIKVKEKMSVMKLRSSTLHLIIKYVMEEIEESPVKGTEQKEMALKILRELVVDLTENEDEKVLTQLLDDGTISNMIDLIVDATKGKLNINMVAKVGAGCFNNCFPYLFKNKK